jgi:hypothetical protein
MNDTQILAIALASVPTMLTVLIGILLNNARLSDVNSRLGELRWESFAPIWTRGSTG